MAPIASTTPPIAGSWVARAPRVAPTSSLTLASAVLIFLVSTASFAEPEPLRDGILAAGRHGSIYGFGTDRAVSSVRIRDFAMRGRRLFALMSAQEPVDPNDPVLPETHSGIARLRGRGLTPHFYPSELDLNSASELAIDRRGRFIVAIPEHDGAPSRVVRISRRGGAAEFLASGSDVNFVNDLVVLRDGTILASVPGRILEIAQDGSGSSVWLDLAEIVADPERTPAPHLDLSCEGNLLLLDRPESVSGNRYPEIISVDPEGRDVEVRITIPLFGGGNDFVATRDGIYLLGWHELIRLRLPQLDSDLFSPPTGQRLAELAVLPERGTRLCRGQR